MSDENRPKNLHEEFYRSVVATKSDEGAGALEKAIESRTRQPPGGTLLLDFGSYSCH